MAKKKSKKYVLFGCPCAESERFSMQGYISSWPDGKIHLAQELSDAIVYDGAKTPGHGAPSDWMKLFKEDYGLDVHPVYVNK